MRSIRLGITVGDVNGIGLEVILKSLSDERILNMCTPVIYGSAKVVAYHKNIVNLESLRFNGLREGDRIRDGRINVVNCWADEVKISLGKVTEDSGKYAALSLLEAVKDLKEKNIHGLVTAPIHKESMKLSGFNYPGHTEFLADQFGVQDHLMCLVADDLRVALATNHIAIQDVSSTLTKDRLNAKILTFNQCLKNSYGIEKPTIAVFGLNPHAGDGGAIGQEEEEIIGPTIIEMKKNGHLVFGPYAADGFFGSGEYKKFDGILAMYHDQGLIPFKLLSFGKGVNMTAGLPFVRTSPDHGTGHLIAGQNKASASSFTQALFLAIQLIKNMPEVDKYSMNEGQINEPKPSGSNS